MNIPLTRPHDGISDLPATWVPPLENGDRLTREEFERRYEAMPETTKAELIEGVVHMPSPVRARLHGNPHARLMGWLAYYEAFTPGVRAADNSTIRFDADNEVQPDGLLFIDAGSGRAKIDEDDYVAGAPQWIGEVASSSVSIDLGPKFRAYERNQVQEYLVWRVLDREIDWFVLQSGMFERTALSEEGYFKSRVFPGLWLDPRAMIEGEMKHVYEVLQQGLNSTEHANFVAHLQGQAQSS